MTDVLGGDRAPWRHDLSADPGTKTEGGRHDAALSFPFGIGTKAVNRCTLITRTDYLVSQPRFLHFTLNHYSFAAMIGYRVLMYGGGVLSALVYLANLRQVRALTQSAESADAGSGELASGLDAV